MNGTVTVPELMNYLKENDLVIVPSDLVRPDKKGARREALKKPALTYTEIAESGLWGHIAHKRAYQIAKADCREGEIIKTSDGRGTEKVIISAVCRIAVARGEMTPNEYRSKINAAIQVQ